ncbi:hypothetical protein GZL_02662 [Streptomyces sp. 769]|nr:hypothetical protein GZL_02662 [Streptomyces sp. 769]
MARRAAAVLRSDPASAPSPRRRSHRVEEPHRTGRWQLMTVTATGMARNQQTSIAFTSAVLG